MICMRGKTHNRHACKCLSKSFEFYSLQVLICRNYKGDVDMSEIDHFLPLLLQQEEEGLMCPVISHGSVHFMWIKHSNLYCILFINGFEWLALPLIQV